MVPVQVNRKIYTVIHRQQRHGWLRVAAGNRVRLLQAHLSKPWEPDRYSFEAPKIYLYLHYLK